MQSQDTLNHQIELTKEALLSFQKAKKTYNYSQEHLETPPVRSKFRHLAKDYQETLKMRIKKQQSLGISKWVFKTSMKVVSQPFPSPVRQAFKNNATMSKLKAYNQASSRNLDEALVIYDQKKAKIHNLLVKIEEAKGANVKLKRQLLSYDAKRNRTLFLWQKYQNIGVEIKELQDFIVKLENMSFENSQTITDTKQKIKKIKEMTQNTMSKSQAADSQIHQLTQTVLRNKQEIQKYSLMKMPNHKQIVSCMFSIGILYEQIFILDIEKTLKAKLSLEQNRVKQQIKDHKNKQFLAKNIYQSIIQSQYNRLIGINCKESHTVVFKVLTVIYMHCRSLLLTNLNSLMKKTSYFAEEFKQIYNYNLFEKYIGKLMERNKSNKQTVTQGDKGQNIRSPQATMIVNIITTKAHYAFVEWVLSSFDFKDSHYSLIFERTQIYLCLFAIEDLVKKQKEGLQKIGYPEKNYSLRISLYDFDQS